MKTYVVKTEARRINIRLVFWGLAIVTDWKWNEWREELLIAMFPYSREYKFLSLHLWKNWWWIDRITRKWIKLHYEPKYKPSYFVEITQGEYDDMKYHCTCSRKEVEMYVGSAYQEIIDGLSKVEGKTMDREAMIEHLKSHKSSYTELCVEDWDKCHAPQK